MPEVNALGRGAKRPIRHMGQKGHPRIRDGNGYLARYQEPAQRLIFDMPQALIVIFLLFFAVLAFAWFYLQRAKARDAATGDSTDSTATPAMAASSPSGDSSYVQSTDASHEHDEHEDHSDHSH
jgi:hypothetical protein